MSWSGRYYRVPELMIEPHPTAPVPILCGGESPAALRRAARLCDGWVGSAYTWEEAESYVRQPWTRRGCGSMYATSGARAGRTIRRDPN